MGDGNPRKFDVIVTVVDTSPGGFDLIVTGLENYGLEITGEPQAHLGLVTGRVTMENFSALADVPGVCGVEPMGTVQIPPPEADIQ